MFKLFHFAIGLIVLFVILYLASMNKKEVKKKIRFIIQLIIFQLVLGYILLESSFGEGLIGGIKVVFQQLMAFSMTGTQFVFGSLASGTGFIFFFNVLMSIVLISAIIGILRYIRLLPLVIRGIGYILSFVSGMGKLESFNAVSSLLLGQSENFIAYKTILDKISERRMYTMSATAMSTVSLSVIGSYMQLLDPKYIVTALILNMVGIFVVLHVLNPYEASEEESYESMEFGSYKKQTFFEMLSEYILDGFKIAIIVGAMMIGFIALLEMLNSIFSAIFGLSFQEIVGYIFYPVAWLLGIPSDQILKAGSIMGTKLVSNEFVAMSNLKDISSHLSAHTIAIISVFLVSFANFSSIGVIVGAVKALNEEQSQHVARHGLRLVFGATCVSFLSALIVGLLI